jgi:hypothetical protein
VQSKSLKPIAVPDRQTGLRVGRTTPDDLINTEASMNLRCNPRGWRLAILTIALLSSTQTVWGEPRLLP